MSGADVVGTIEAARARLRRARAEVCRVLGSEAVEPRPGRDLLDEPNHPAPARAVVFGVGAAISAAVAATLGPEIALAPLAATAAVALLGREPLRARAARLAREMEEEAASLLARISERSLREVAHLVSSAGTLDRAALRHAAAEPPLRAPFAEARLVCPSCAASDRGAEFARWRACPRCRSQAFLERVELAAADPAVREALRAYARWRDESRALARALAVARRIAALAYRPEREVIARPTARRRLPRQVEAPALSSSPPPAV